MSTAMNKQVVRNILRARGRHVNPEQAHIQDKEPAGCCVDTEALLVVCPDANHPWHRATVNSIETINDKGLVTLSFTDSTGTSHNARLPMCSAPEEGECCYDAVNGVVLCNDPNHPMHNKPASLVDDLGNGYVYICGGLDPESSAMTCARMPLCPDQPPEGCCYDAISGAIVCESGAFPNGLTPQLVKQGTDDKGKGYVVVIDPQLNGGNRTLLYLCPEQPPGECCFDVATGKLSCPGSASFDGLEVSLEHMTDVMEDGNIYAVVSHPDLPQGVGEFLLCSQEVPSDCCYDGQNKVLICGNSELNGTTAGVVTQFEGPDGKPWVSVSWEGGGARMPLCTPSCPPSYCCVNIQTGMFVCPGESALNNQPADVADVESDGSYSFAVLSDGTRVPVCGSHTPPPECPEGMWMTPDRECMDPPWGETCPPGMWRDPDGICRMPPECPECPKYRPGECPKCLPPQGFPPRNDGPCCDSCADGLPCTGCSDDKHVNPSPPRRRRRRRIRRHLRGYAYGTPGGLLAKGLVKRDHSGACTKADLDAGGCYSVTHDMCFVPCGINSLTAPVSKRDHSGPCTDADLKAGGCYSTTHDQCFVPCGIEGSITAPSQGLGRGRVRPWAV